MTTSTETCQACQGKGYTCGEPCSDCLCSGELPIPATRQAAVRVELTAEEHCQLVEEFGGEPCRACKGTGCTDCDDTGLEGIRQCGPVPAGDVNSEGGG